MTEGANPIPADVRGKVLRTLRDRKGKACFVSELVALLRRSSIGKEELDQAVTALSTEGLVIVRDNFCADPHLAEVDLRVAALVEGGADGYAAALHEIDVAWNQWLGEFLANHRCG
jgi:DNA-binding transcriptional ArsR family regulator